MDIYDAVISGGGPGGYTAAIRAAQLGQTVAIVERDKLGGTCLHKGCIPSKALLRSAEVYETIRRSASFGIETEGQRLRFDSVQSRKASIVEQLYKGVQFLMKKNKIAVFSGHGTIVSAEPADGCSGIVAVENAEAGGSEPIQLGYRNLIVATGSRTRSLPGLEPDGEFVLTSDDALELAELPGSILIVGGGVIGVEWASMLNDFGVNVTIVEFAERLLPAEDADISKELQRLYAKRGIKVLTGAKLLTDTLRFEDSRITVQAEQAAGVKELQADKMLIAVGRQANASGFGLERTNVRIERGLIAVDEYMRTDHPHIYAVGDVIGGLQLAHAASHEGIAAAEHLSGLTPHKTESARIPRCIYGRPEIASVGLTERQATESGREVKTSKLSFKGIGKALVYGAADGFAKVVADASSGEILGVHLIGPHVTDYIGEAALAQLLGAASLQVGTMIHPHPTLSEILGEAMLALDGRAINM